MDIKPQNNSIKEKILQDLGENPTEIDIRYISYVTNIPTSQIKLWIDESLKSDFKNDMASKECLIIGSKKPKGIKSVKIKIETPLNDNHQAQNQQEEQKQINELNFQDRQIQKDSKIKQKNQQVIQKQKLNQQVLEQVLNEPNKKIAPIILQNQNQNKSLQIKNHQELKDQHQNTQQKNQNNIRVQKEGQKQSIQPVIKYNNKNTNEVPSQFPCISNNIELLNQTKNLQQNDQIPIQNNTNVEKEQNNDKNNKYIEQKEQLENQNNVNLKNQKTNDLEQQIAHCVDQSDASNNNIGKKNQKINQSQQIQNNQKPNEIQQQNYNQLEQNFQPISISSSSSPRIHLYQQLQNQSQSNNIKPFQRVPTNQENQINNQINYSKLQNQTQNSLRQQNLQLNQSFGFECQSSQFQNINQDQRHIGQQYKFNQEDQPYIVQVPLLHQAYQPSQQQYIQTPIINPIQTLGNQQQIQMPNQTQEQNYFQQYAYYDANSLQKLQQSFDFILLSQNTHQLNLLQKLDQIINLIQKQQSKK